LGEHYPTFRIAFVCRAFDSVIVKRKSILVFEIPELLTQDTESCPKGIKSSATSLFEIQIVQKLLLIPRCKVFFQNLNVLSRSRNSLFFWNQILADRHINKKPRFYPNLKFSPTQTSFLISSACNIPIRKLVWGRVSSVCSDSSRSGQFGVRKPVEGRYTLPFSKVQTCPKGHAAFCIMGSGAVCRASRRPPTPG